MKFSYKGIDEVGSNVSGSLEAETKEEAYNQLAARGVLPSEVKGGESAIDKYLYDLSMATTAVKPVDLIFFTKQFRTLFKSGISVTEALKILEFQTVNKKMKHVLTKMNEDISTGSSLADAFEKHGEIFPPVYVSMVRAGEASGSLPQVLERLVYLLDHEHKVKTKIKSAMSYPKIVVFALVGAFFFLLNFVIPTFAQMFEDTGLDLPMPTKVAILLYNIINQWWMISLPIFIALITAFIFYKRSAMGTMHIDRLMLALPILGPVFSKAAMSRFASIFAILQVSGLSVLASMKILSDSIGNSAISAEFDKISDKLREGRGISAPLRSAKYFTPMVINMVEVGEESGNLDQMLQEISLHYDDEVEYEVGRMTELLGPVLIAALAGVVGFFALAIFMPMWDMSKMAS